MSGARPTEDVVSRWRALLGVGASLWAGSGRVEVEADWSLAFSGARTADFNVILCHGSDGARDLARSLEEVRAAKVPAVIVVSGAALGMTNLLAGEGWVCVGAKPFRGHGRPARRARVFAEVALPAASAESPTREAWGIFDGDELRAWVSSPSKTSS